MTKRTLISVVPNDFTTSPFDEIGLGYQVHLLSEQMMNIGLTPYSALSVFRQAQGVPGRTIQRPCHLILGEVVSARQYEKWKKSISAIRPGVWVRLLIEEVQDQDQSNGGRLERPSQLLPGLYQYLATYRQHNMKLRGGVK